jgi:Arylsulfotransferase (ASST)
MKKIKFLAIFSGLLFMLFLTACSSATTAKLQSPQYYSPLQNAEYVSTGATIAVRYGPSLTDQNLSAVNFTVQGAKSGAHAGQTILADDHQTIIFKPSKPFTPGEQVKVDVSGLNLDAQHNYRPLSYTFAVATNQQPGGVGISNSIPSSPPKSAFPDFLTVPQDIPHFTVTQASPDNGEGDIFVAPFYWTKSTVGSYLLILNGQGQLVYYQSVAEAQSAFDFKVQPNGLLSYFDQKSTTFYVMDSHYKVVNTYQAGNGYTADLHELQLLPNGDALLMAYDDETVDMSKVVKGGKPDATVTGLIIQELDPAKNVIFEWRSWDHIAYADSTASLTDQKIDLVHGNALALADDGNLLLSSRNLSEITKINLKTGDIIWRFGGKANQFKLIGGQPFAFQHDVRQLPNGDITIFDNQGTQQNPATSHGLEYKLDEKNRTATQVWEYTHTPPVFATFMGDTQRLSDGNTFLDWGAPSTADGFDWVTMNEVSPDGKTVFELSFDQPYVSYRAFRFPWQGSPDTLPDLAFKAGASGNGITLGYSWNGATGVASYRLFGGSSPQSLNQIEEKARTDFETQSDLTNLAQDECYFQVAALDQAGKELARSKVISSDPATCPPVS